MFLVIYYHLLSHSQIIIMNIQDPLKDRSISISEFVDNRSVEVQQFIKALNQKTCAKKVKLIPKNIRRRAMSHNRYRIPLRHRIAINQELKTTQSMQKIPRCRKTIRKKHLLIKEYKKRQSKIRWLGNHLWSAKRMKMIQYYGYKIAGNLNDKSDRACYRFSRYGCCLVNLSHYQILKLTTFDSQQCHALKNFFQKIPSKDSQYQDTILQKQGKMICPVIIFKNQFEYIVLYHPAARKQIQELMIPGFQKQVYSQQFEIYRLLGPQSLQKVSLLVENIGYNNHLGSITAQFKNKSNPNFYEKNLTAPIDISNCKCQNKLILSPSKSITQYIKQDYDSKPTNLFYSTNVYQGHQTFWKKGFEESPQQAKYQFTTRSKYTHKRKHKMSKQDKQKMMKENPLLTTTANKQKDKIIQQKQQIIYQIKQPLKQKPITDRRLLISLINNNSDTDGCLLIFSNFDFSYIWRKLTFLNCKVLGLNQYEAVLNQNQQKVYPRDYPQTQGFHKHFQDKLDQNILKYRRRPPTKVPHYKSISSPFPFGLSIPLLSTYLKKQFPYKLVNYVCVGRGSLPVNSYICRPTEEDFNKLKQRLERNQTISHVYKQKQIEIQKPSRKQLLRMNNNQLIQYFMMTEMDRQIVGFITSGGINFKMSRGFGLGIIQRDYQLPYVLVRKPTSPFYFFAQAR